VAAPKYEMTLSLSVIDHLGLNLYSSTPAVLSEVVANAWDADAENVDIVYRADRVTITDDGTGMSLTEMNEKFLTVGYRRRETEGVLTPKHKRHVMGRKGIGKLSLFAIADTIRVESVKKTKGGLEKNGFIMESDGIRAAAKAEKPYYPKALPPSYVKIDRGTRITITNLNSRATALGERALRVRLARRFSIIGADFKFKVTVNGDPIGVEDRGYFQKVEFLWSIGDVGNRYEKQATAAKQKARVDGVIDEAKNFRVTGWVGTVDERKSIEDVNNTVVLLAWGKLIQEDVLGAIQAGGLYTKYLIGELRADFLDVDDEPDITTSDRQRLKEDDPRYEQILEWFNKNVLRVVEANWSAWRGAAALETALEIPEVKAWHDSLSKDSKRFAGQLFAKIGKFPKDNEQEKRELYKYTILAFEKLRLREALTAIDEITEDADMSVVQAVFDGVDELEAMGYYDIAKGRLEVIDAFSKVVPKEKEKIIQQYLYDHLWLLHPSWERSATNAQIEQAVDKEFKKIDASLTAEEKAGRVDIRYRTAAGKHIVIELKKYDASVNLYRLLGQIEKYRSALEKLLHTKFPNEPRDIEIIVLHGKPLSPQSVSETQRTELLRAQNARAIPYDTLIKESLDAYKDYLEVNKRLSKLTEIIDSLSGD
jgi:hypothetical protein